MYKTAETKIDSLIYWFIKFINNFFCEKRKFALVGNEKMKIKMDRKNDRSNNRLNKWAIDWSTEQ